MDRDLVLEALGVICNATVTSIQKQRSQNVQACDCAGGTQQMMSIKSLFTNVLCGDQTCKVARSNLLRFNSDSTDSVQQRGYLVLDFAEDQKLDSVLVLDEDEFLDPRFDYDYTHLKDKDVFYRGGEKYERPCGWYRFGIKVLNEFENNTWLGTTRRTTQSQPGEWPVSYHGTSNTGAEGIIEGHYKPGPGQAYGRGIYSTPDLSEAEGYAKRFRSKKTGKWYKVILQNRINPKHREKHNGGKYWLVPIKAGTSKEEEERLVDEAIRPYGLLLKEA